MGRNTPPFPPPLPLVGVQQESTHYHMARGQSWQERVHIRESYLCIYVEYSTHNRIEYYIYEAFIKRQNEVYYLFFQMYCREG